MRSLLVSCQVTKFTKVLSPSTGLFSIWTEKAETEVPSVLYNLKSRVQNFLWQLLVYSKPSVERNKVMEYLPPLRRTADMDWDWEGTLIGTNVRVFAGIKNRRLKRSSLTKQATVRKGGTVLTIEQPEWRTWEVQVRLRVTDLSVSFSLLLLLPDCLPDQFKTGNESRREDGCLWRQSRHKFA